MQKEIDDLNEKLKRMSVVDVSMISGLTRLTVSSDAWHQAHPRASNFLFGAKQRIIVNELRESIAVYLPLSDYYIYIKCCFSKQ